MVSCYNNPQDAKESNIFNLDHFNRRISSMKVKVTIPAVPTQLARDESIDLGKTDVPILHGFQSLDRHLDVTPQDLSKRWDISLITATQTLKETTQWFLRSALLLLSREYRMDRVFSRKTLSSN